MRNCVKDDYFKLVIENTIIQNGVCSNCCGSHCFVEAAIVTAIFYHKPLEEQLDAALNSKHLFELFLFLSTWQFTVHYSGTNIHNNL